MSSNEDILYLCDRCRYFLLNARPPIHGAAISPTIQKCIEQALGKIKKVEKVCTSSNFKIALSGITNCGKSTLLSALLGYEAAPVKNCPWSAAPVEYRYADDGKFHLSMCYSETIQTSNSVFDAPQGLLAELERNATAMDADKQARAERIIVRLPAPVLAEGELTLVDLPGMGATNGETEEGLHDKALMDYLAAGRVHRFFWIVKDNISDDELEFFNKNLKENCADLIVNLTEDRTAEEKLRWQNRYQEVLGNFLQVHFVNAQDALTGVRNGDEEKKKRSNINEIFTQISSFSSKEKRTESALRDIYNLLYSIAQYIWDFSDDKIKWLPTAELMLLEAMEKNYSEGESISLLNKLKMGEDTCQL